MIQVGPQRLAMPLIAGPGSSRHSGAGARGRGRWRDAPPPGARPRRGRAWTGRSICMARSTVR